MSNIRATKRAAKKTTPDAIFQPLSSAAKVTKGNKPLRRRTRKAATRPDLIRAVYLIEQNDRLTPKETVEAVKKYFSVDITTKHVYVFRQKERKAGRLTQHDRTARFTNNGIVETRIKLAGVNLSSVSF